jgi:hypothetical protein
VSVPSRRRKALKKVGGAYCPMAAATTEAALEMRDASMVPATPHRTCCLVLHLASSWAPSSPCGSSFGVPKNPARRIARPKKAPLTKASDAKAKATNTKTARSPQVSASRGSRASGIRIATVPTPAGMPAANIVISRTLLPPRRNHLSGELNHEREGLFVDPAHIPDNSGTSHGSTTDKYSVGGTIRKPSGANANQ